MITFIIGTDTNVGKTYYGKQQIEKGKRVLKPIETGKKAFSNLEDSDCYTYSRMQNLHISDVNVYFFNEPLSPHLASRIDGIDIDINRIKDFINVNRGSYIELAGGLMVPLNKNYTQLDLIKSIPCANVDIVVDNKLGCINHTLLTLEVLKYNKISTGKLFFNNKSQKQNKMTKDNIEIVSQFVNASKIL